MWFSFRAVQFCPTLVRWPLGGVAELLRYAPAGIVALEVGGVESGGSEMSDEGFDDDPSHPGSVPAALLGQR